MKESNIVPSSPQLFIVAIGPVQGFIAAARRMRDLYFGSLMLSEIAQGVAALLHKEFAAELIFPNQLNRDEGQTNKVLCVLKTGTPQQAAACVACVVSGRLQAYGEECLAAIEKARLSSAIDKDRFQKQLADALQTYCAWAQLAPEGTGYSIAYRQANALLEARKLVRNFGPNPSAAPGARLASLDGLRESVIAGSDHGYAAIDDAVGASVQRLRQRMGIDAQEQLDAVGLIKRVLGKERGFPSVLRVALEPWVAAWPLAARTELAGHMSALQAAELVSTNRCVANDPLAKFPFDGEVLLDSRRRKLLLDPTLPANAISALQELDAALHADALKSKDEPSSAKWALPGEDSLHVAVLVADGDRMGRLLSNPVVLGDPSTHRNIAQKLAELAQTLRAVVRCHQGCCLYSGGDDLLAVLPVNKALDCAQALRHAFVSALSEVVPVRAGRATLSIGVAVGQAMSPMGELLTAAQTALHTAKNGGDGEGLRNALCLAIKPRAGGLRQVLDTWELGEKEREALQVDAEPEDQALVPRMKAWQAAFADGVLSGSLPYDLLTQLRNEPTMAVPHIAHRVLTRRINDVEAVNTLTRLVQGHWQRGLALDRTPQHMAQLLADEWYVARWLAAQPRPPSERAACEAKQGIAHAQ